jgi:hypothetical protein
LAHNNLNEIIISESWGVDSSKIAYTEIQKQNAKKEYSIIENYLEDLRFSLYE